MTGYAPKQLKHDWTATALKKVLVTTGESRLEKRLLCLTHPRLYVTINGTNTHREVCCVWKGINKFFTNNRHKDQSANDRLKMF